MPTEFMAEFLLNLVRQLRLLDTEELRTHVESAARSQSIFDSAGPIIDPTAWRNMTSNGQRDRAGLQLEVARKLLEIRVLIDQYEVVGADQPDRSAR